jgi:hypothetical protein
MTSDDLGGRSKRPKCPFLIWRKNGHFPHCVQYSLIISLQNPPNNMHIFSECHNIYEKRQYCLYSRTHLHPTRQTDRDLWYVFDMKIWKVFGIQFDRYIGQTRIKNLHISRSKIKIFDRGIWRFLIGVWPIYQSNSYQIFWSDFNIKSDQQNIKCLVGISNQWGHFSFRPHVHCQWHHQAQVPWANHW